MVELKFYVLQKNQFWRTYPLRFIELEVHCRFLLVSKSSLESLVISVPTLLGFESNFSWLKLIQWVLDFLLMKHLLE
jgi:hypothetical protein